MKRVALVFLAVAVMAIVAWLVNDISVGALLSGHRHDPLAYAIKLTIQLILGLSAAGVIAVVVSTAGSIVRMTMRLGGYRHNKLEWQWVSAEGAIVGMVVVGAWLGWSPREIYPHPEETSQIEIRNPSLLENPFGLPPGSMGLSALIVTYRDAKGSTLVQKSYEFDDVTAAKQEARCTILWGAKGTQRAIVQLANGNCLVFPEHWEDNDDCPPEDVSEAYLKGETIDETYRPFQDVGGGRRESSQPH
jgi:hypothetical protein